MPIAEVVTLQRPTNEDTIKRLEEALDMARKGEIESVAVAFVRYDGVVNGGFSEANNGVTLLGSLELLGFRMRRSLLNLGDED